MAYDGEGTFVVDSPYGIPLEYDLMGRCFSKGGYRTAFIGKWNVGHVEENYLPHRRGFDSSIMYNSDAIHYYNYTASPSLFVSDLEIDVSVVDMLTGEANEPFKLDVDDVGTYTSTLFTDRAQGELEKTQTDDRSLFLYLAFQAVHIPHNTPPEELFDLSDEWKLDDVVTHDRYHFTKTAVAMDRSIKRLMNHVENLGLEYKMLLAVASDNGACPTDGGNNYPMRGGKFQSWEGGVHVPSFVWSGAMESAVKGTNSTTLFHAVDWLPTLAKAVGAVDDTSTQLKGIDGKDMSKSILHGDTDGTERKELLLRMNKWSASASGKSLETLSFNESYMSLIKIDDGHIWKITTNQWHGPRIAPSHKASNVSCFDQEGDKHQYLFDLASDPLENDNLYDKRPDIFSNLTLSLRSHWEKATVPVWAYPESTNAYDAWDSDIGGDGYVSPWHRPEASVYLGKDDDENALRETQGTENTASDGIAVHPTR